MTGGGKRKKALSYHYVHQQLFKILFRVYYCLDFEWYTLRMQTCQHEISTKQLAFFKNEKGFSMC